MAAYLIERNPAAEPWALEYATLYLEEGTAEGVRGDGAWIQSCKETGNFTFTGGTAVTFDQNNFCGLGVLKKGMKGHSFATPRLGIRAQIQHLKGYATATPLVNECIDPRYKYISPKGKAPTFEELAGKWAVPGYDTSKASSLQDAMNKGIGYGFDIVAGIEAMKKIKTEEKEMEKMIINVHAGHNPDGKIACGAVGLIKESTEARKVKDKVIALLRACGHTVYDCTVDDGANANDVLKKIVAKCNARTADLDVSIHFNAGANDKAGNSKTTGTEVFIYNSSSTAKPYAQKVARSIAGLGYKLRDDAVKDDVKNANYLYVLKNTKAPAMLVECCFVDDKDDVALYNADKMAAAIVSGITGKAVQANTTTTTPPAATTTTAKKLYRVQVGAYSKQENAENMKAKLKAAGFDAVVVEA